jgi:hypothetical protein
VCITPISEDHGQKEACRKAGAPSNHPPFGRLHQRRLTSLALPVKTSPPLFVAFASIDEALGAMPERYRLDVEKAMRPLADRGMPPALSVGVVAILFGVSAAFVRAMASRPRRYYRFFQIRKGKKVRQISAPRIGLKLVQSWIGYHLARAIQLPPNVYGFIPGVCGVLEAAAAHSGARWVYSLDLRDFFSSVSPERTERALVSLGYPPSSAAFIAGICSLDGALPQGSPASPVLSNLAFLETDQALTAIADDLGVRYTRYADDLVFSGLESPPAELCSRVRDCLTLHGWQIATEKEHMALAPARLKVHGLLVHGAQPRLTKGYRNRIRAYRHLVASGRVREADRAKIAGHLAYAEQVDRGPRE